ncbi:MAG: Flp pilus assembly complex ATPase component TadA [Sandaracinus sp.]|nr:Flp pilus assembly complex ATPase component TadA [Sandaracinus sp.]MCB9623315.1 Flp pilus assembly complex ATPase component TadA [Sandaracinus sp.]
MDTGVLLSIEMPDGSVEELPIQAQGPVVIGRDPSCHVVLPSPEVSRRHLIVEPSARGFKLTDQSANGTLMGNQRVKRSKVDTPPNVPLRIGPYLVRLRRIGDPPPPPLPPPGHPGGPQPVAAAPSPQALSPQPGNVTAQAPSPPRPPAPPAAAKKSAGSLIEHEKEEILRVAGSTAVIPAELRRRVHRMLLDHLDLVALDRSNMDDDVMRPKVLAALGRIMTQLTHDIPPEVDRQAFMREMADEALGLGPLERLLADEDVSEVMVVHPYKIYIEKKGKIWATDLRFTDDESARAVIERIVTPLGRRIDESTPLVDARLKDGSRVNAVIKPLAINGACITIRKFQKNPLKIDDLVRFGSMTDRMASFLVRAVKVRKNIVISGGTGSGKTTLLNVLSGAIPGRERVVTIEDAAELRLEQPHVVSLETRPANMEGKGEYSIRDLVKNALRMRPDRIVVGECRGGEALDMLQAMNTGHEGSMTTTHANSPTEAAKRIETLCLMSGIDLPSRAIREQIAGSVHLIVQQTRLSDGSRRVTAITEVSGLDDNGEFVLNDIFAYYRTGTKPDGTIVGEYRASGYLPSFLDEFITFGLVGEGGEYL